MDVNCVHRVGSSIDFYTESMYVSIGTMAGNQILSLKGGQLLHAYPSMPSEHTKCTCT